ncbi:MAG: N-acetyl-gamma-glutamyl-phosphate reductase [Candidatus Margulisbacteria bacterium GWF2_35_9]|nr:MAG: N-acetyl-gamma-glutamyl-phosphate reductase [Candidatus Margulisbacteria bacterium GWF2_35_9]
MKKIGIIGATGFTAYELLKILLNHSHIEISYLASISSSGKKLVDIHPDLNKIDLVLEKYDISEIKSRKLACVFLTIPHGTAMKYVPELIDAGVKVIDMSADFRFNDYKTYEKVYATHTSPEYCKKSVFGLPEVFREKIKHTHLLGNPGCYVTSALLPLTPIKNDITDIIIDAKSGISGAGKKEVETHLAEYMKENFKAYKVAVHRHQPEIETYLDHKIEFIPHLLPIYQGILSTIYFRSNLSLDELKDKLVNAYKNETFVKILSDEDPEIKQVAGTNVCNIRLYPASRSGQFIIVSVLDNLIKGASGQAVQNMNIMLGFEEDESLILEKKF